MNKIFNPVANLIKKPLVKCKDALKGFQAEPASTIYILIIVLLLGWGWHLLLKSALSKEKGSLEIVDVLATILILVGAIWTAFGVMLSPKAKGDLNKLSLDDYIKFKQSGLNGQGPEDPIKAIVNVLVIASNFATSGLFLVALGSILLVLKPLIQRLFT